VLHVAEGGATKGQDGRAHLSVADDLDAEHIGESWAAVIAKRPENQVLALLVEDQDSGKHLGEIVDVLRWPGAVRIGIWRGAMGPPGARSGLLGQNSGCGIGNGAAAAKRQAVNAPTVP